MFPRSGDYSEYSLINTDEIVKCAINDKYEQQRSRILESLDIPNLQLVNKPLKRVGNYIDLKIMLHYQSPKVELWKLDGCEDENEEDHIEAKTTENDLGKGEREQLVADLRKLFAIKIYSKKQLMRKNVVYSLNGITKTQLHRVINEIKILQDLLKHDPRKHYIVRLNQVLESDKNNLNSGKFYLVYDFYPLGPTMGPYHRYGHWEDADCKSGTTIAPNNIKRGSSSESSSTELANESLKSENKLVYIPNPVLKGIGEEGIKHFVYCVATALDKLHQLGIAHRDVKPDNLLIAENGDVVLIDFNSAEYLIEGKYVSGTEGTYAFFPPEYCKLSFNPYDDSKDEHSEHSFCKLLGCPADMWALGVTIWCWLFNELPFQGNNILDLFSNIANCQPVIPDKIDISTQVKDIISKLLNPDPTHRLTAKQLLESEWLSNHTSRTQNY